MLKVIRNDLVNGPSELTKMVNNEDSRKLCSVSTLSMWKAGNHIMPVHYGAYASSTR